MWIQPNTVNNVPTRRRFPREICPTFFSWSRFLQRVNTVHPFPEQCQTSGRKLQLPRWCKLAPPLSTRMIQQTRSHLWAGEQLTADLRAAQRAACCQLPPDVCVFHLHHCEDLANRTRSFYTAASSTRTVSSPQYRCLVITKNVS